MRTFMVLGHRGLPGTGAENSIVSVRAAMAAGCLGVEVDVRQSADGQLVLSHDSIHYGLPIETHTLSELLGEAPIDTLSDLLGEGTGMLDLEIKAPLTGQDSLVESLLECLAGRKDDLLISSFSLPILEALAPSGHRLGVLTSPWYDPDGTLAAVGARSVGASTVLPNDASLMGPQVIEEAASHGIQVIAWTVNDPARASELMRWGAAGVITDSPIPVLAATT